MAFRFVHMADLHLDTPFVGDREHRDALRRLQGETFRAAIDLALREEVHAVIVSGDLADGENLSYASALAVYDGFSRLLEGGIAVIYAHGNHDPASAMHRLTLPRGVTVFSSMDPECITVYDRQDRPVGQVAGVGYDRSYEEEFPLMRFPARGILPMVGVAHTQLTEMAGAGTGYAPVSARSLLMLGYDYWALGHIHQHTAPDPRVVYAGALTGRDYGETGEKGVLLVEAEARAVPRRVFCPLSRTGFWDETAPDMTDCADLPALTSLLAGHAAARLPARLPEMAMLRMTLSGPCGCAGELTGAWGGENLAALEGELARRLGVTRVTLRLRDLTLPMDTAEFAREQHVLGTALQIWAEAGTDDAVMESVLREIEDIRLAGCASRSAGPLRDYARDLLPGLDKVIARRMRKEDRT